MKTSLNYLFVTLSLLLLPMITSAQSTNYTLDKSSTIVIKGTSTIHDWEADVKQMDVKIALVPERLQEEPVTNPVESFALAVPVKSIESGKGGMNRKIYDALKVKDHPYIRFKLISAEISGENNSTDSFELNATGILTIKGNAKEVTFPVQVTRTGDNTFRFEGSYSLNMKDYEVDPPSAMFGAIKSGEKVEIIFNILVNK